MDAIVAENPRAVIGNNAPPEPTPYEQAEQKVGDVWGEAKLWLDGAAVDSQAIADDISNLLSLIRDARKFAEAQRKIEKDPFDKAAAEVQSRYKPLIEKADLAITACKKALQPWLDKRDAEIRAEAERKRKEAEEKAAAAREALRAADAANLEARAQAEALAKQAKEAQKAANKAERQTATAGGGMGRATGLRTTYVATITDPIAFGRYAWSQCREEYQAFLQGLADRLVHGGARVLPGVEIREEKKAV